MVGKRSPSKMGVFATSAATKAVLSDILDLLKAWSNLNPVRAHCRVFDLSQAVPQAWISLSSSTRAIVFVHGFGGSAQDTWRGFESITGHAEFENSDLYFFEYDSKNQPIDTSSFLLLESLAEVLDPESSLVALGSDFPSRSYDELILCGHSLGGVVIRRAVVRAHKHDQVTQASKLIRQASVKLFAPAQGGVQVSGWLGLAALVGLGVLKGKWRTVDELSSGSQTLDLLRQETDLIAEQSPATNSAIAQTLWAGQEQIIVSGFDYSNDKPSGVAVDKTHAAVCKPTAAYRLPISFLAGGAG